MELNDCLFSLHSFGRVTVHGIYRIKISMQLTVWRRIRRNPIIRYIMIYLPMFISMKEFLHFKKKMERWEDLVGMLQKSNTIWATCKRQRG